MSESLAYNIDCMEYMRGLPDNYFDLCVTDPPYGDGVASEKRADCHNLRGRFSKYDVGDGGSQIVNVERERDGTHGTDRERTSDSRTEHGATRSGVKRQLRFHGGSKSANDPWNKYLNPQSSILNPQSSASGKTVTRTGGTWAEKYGKKS